MTAQRPTKGTEDPIVTQLNALARRAWEQRRELALVGCDLFAVVLFPGGVTRTSYDVSKRNARRWIKRTVNESNERGPSVSLFDITRQKGPEALDVY